MRHLTVYNRFAMIIAVLTVVFVAALTEQVMVLRSTVIEERKTKIFDLVQAAKKILASYDAKAKAGKMPAPQARQLAFDAIGAMRWGTSDDYLGIYGAGAADAGVTYVHPNPKYINVKRLDSKDSHGFANIQAIVDANPAAHRLLLGSSGDQLALMTGIPAINDGYSSQDLDKKVLVYRPGWYVGWNDFDQDILNSLSAYRLDEVANFPVFDREDRDRLKLYRMVPLKEAQQ